MTQAETVIKAFEKARASGRTSLGALHDALVGVEVSDRTVSDGRSRPQVVTYTFADGSAVWREEAKADLHEQLF
jgi:hypothetical protein